MTLPVPEFPKNLFDGNEQDTGNDGAPDPQKYQALDYNTLATEIIALQLELRDGAILAVKNDSGVLINQGDNIRIATYDPVSELPRAVLADASSPSTLSDGVALQAIPDGDTGNMGKQFVLRDLNTQALGPAGTKLFLSTTPGDVTPTAPTNAQRVGLVLRQSTTVGVILYEVSASETVDLHALGGASHVASSLAELNALVTGGDLDFDSAARTPTAHEPAHRQAGGDPLDVELLGAPGGAASEVLTADGAGGVAFLPAGTPGAHAATTHGDGQTDELPVAGLAEAAAPGNDVSQALRPDGAGGVAFSDVAHSDLTGVGTGDHHAQLHAADHADGAGDELEVEDLATGVLDTTQRLAPDGAGGLAFSSVGSSVVNTTIGLVGAALTTLGTIAIPDDTAVLIIARIVGRRTDSADRAVYIRRAVVYREAAGIATLEGGVDTTLTRESSGPFNATIDVDGGNNARIRVQGLAGSTMNWRSEHIEVSVG